jgi:hypothetical protein
MLLKHKTRDILKKYSEGLTTELPGFVSGELNFSLQFRARLLTKGHPAAVRVNDAH